MNTPADTLALVRPEILALAPYSSARKESKGGKVWLDANENPATPHAGAPLLNRYPDPQPPELVARLAGLYGAAPESVLVTRGSDEGIDLLVRAFCRAGQDAIVITPPTYGMYVVAAGIQGAAVRTAPLVLEKDFAVDPAAVLAAVDASVKLVFLCSPNNPTGQNLARADVLRIVDALAGRAVVVVDEAYAEFSTSESLVTALPTRANLVVLRTLSKAFGLAGARVGVTLAAPEVIAVLQKILAPYPLPTPVIQAALAALTPEAIAAARRSATELVAGRQRLAAALLRLPYVRQIWPSDTNFLLVAVTDSARLMQLCRTAGLIIRDRSKDVPNTVRITIGSPTELDFALEVLGSAGL
jgi:histidinol-phosphate aminotransferase